MPPIVFKYPDAVEYKISEHLLRGQPHNGHTSIELDLQKIDNMWKHDEYTYSGLGGSDRKESKIIAAKKDITSGSIYMPIIVLHGNPPHELEFMDGRHRTAALIELGYKTATFVIPTAQEELFRNAFGVTS